MKKSNVQRATLALVLGGTMLFCLPTAFAQKTESSEPPEMSDLDEIVVRRDAKAKVPLRYAPIREADIAWERRIWRVIDVREKMNRSFTYPGSPLIQHFMIAAMAGDLPIFDGENDRFAKKLTGTNLINTFATTDTILRYNVETEEEEVVIVENQLNLEDVLRFRIKEVWFFDKNTATLRVRILGIAPLIEVFDREGNFRYEKPLFWVHYPTARPILAKHKAYLHGDNLAAQMTWEDIFEMRLFSSTIFKENNIYDRRLEDYMSGTEKIIAAHRIHAEIFNLEHDLWQF